MRLTTPDDILDHLARRLPSFIPDGEPVRLEGGLLNYVWRVPGGATSVVVKVAPPYVATAPEVPLDPLRIVYEARSLAAVGPGGSLHDACVEGVRPPQLIDLDERAHAIIMTDLGAHPTLGQWLRTEPPEARAADAGRRLGAFIGSLHRLSRGRKVLAVAFNNQPVQQTRHEVQYRAVQAMARRAGLPDAEALGARAVALGERLLKPGRCLIMGDLWPSSVLCTDDGLRVIDWEMAHYGQPAQDLGHLAAHLWMLAQQGPSEAVAAAARACGRAFLESYRATLGPDTHRLLDAHTAADCAVHFGAEILVRTVGPFQHSGLYAGLPPEAPAVQEAVGVAAEHLRRPAQADTFSLVRGEVERAAG